VRDINRQVGDKDRSLKEKIDELEKANKAKKSADTKHSELRLDFEETEKRLSQVER